MRHQYIFLFIAIFGISSFITNAQQPVEISGRIVDGELLEPLTGVNISVKGKSFGTVSDSLGYFYLFVNESLPLTLQFSMIGFKTSEFIVEKTPISEIRITMPHETYTSDEIIISTKVVEVEQKTLQKPISIEMIDALSIRETPSVNFYEAIAHLKGVDITTQSMQFTTINARGFNSTKNIRFVQVVDGMDNQIPGMNFSIGNIAGLSELDVESIEFMPGPSSVVYGANALNGTLVMKSKNPFQYQGLSGYLKPGLSDLKDVGIHTARYSAKPMFDGGLRYAASLSKKVAFKINVSYMRGKDWYAKDFTNIRPGIHTEETDPGYNALNKYGDEITKVLPVGEEGKDIIVARTGYRDQDLVNNNVKSIKLNAALHYRINKNLHAIFSGNYGNATTIFTGDNRISLGNFRVYQWKTEMKGNNYLFRAYTTRQNSGDTFDSRFLAVHLNEKSATDEKWFRDYYNAYADQLLFWNIPPNNHYEARKFADRNRLLPNTDEFIKEKEGIINNPDFTEGARIINNSNLYHIDGLYSLEDHISWADVELGVSYRYTDLESNGSIFPDTTGNDIFFTEFGAFVQISRRILNESVLFTGSLRYDKSEKFEGHLSPRLLALYTYNKNHNFRASFFTSYRYPGAREQFINKDLGYARLLGGLNPLFKPYDLFENSFYYPYIKDFNKRVESDIFNEENPYGSDQAILKNLPILAQGIVPEGAFDELKPEHVLTFELGYKTKLFEKLFVDAVYYNSIYNDFIGMVELVKPRTSPQVDLFISAHQLNNSGQNEFIFLYTNAHENVMIQGASLGLKLVLPKGVYISGNASWSDLKSSLNDPVIPGFNTPEFKGNLSISRRRLGNPHYFKGLDNIGFSLVWRYQSGFLWESPYATGWLKPISTCDLQVSYSFINNRSVLKAGASNLFNAPYTNSYGGVQVGAIYYISFSIENLIKL